MKKQFVTITMVMAMILFVPTSCAGGNKKNDNNADLEFARMSEEVPEETMQLYNNLMDSFSDDWEDVEPAPDAYPEYYGGVFISNAGKLVVMMTEESDENRADVVARVKSEDFETELCEYSYREMMEVMNRIDQFLSDPEVPGSHPVIQNFGGSIADILENRVVVHLMDASPDVLAAFVRDVSDSNCIMFKEGGMFE